MKTKPFDAIGLFERLHIALLFLGVLALMMISIGSVWSYVTSPDRGKAPTGQTPSLQDISTAQDANRHMPAVNIPPDAHLIVSTRSGDILTTADGTIFEPTGLLGNEVSSSPDGNRLIYWRGSNLLSYFHKQENIFNLSASEGALGRFAWSPDSQTLLIVVSGPFGNYLNRVRLSDSFQLAPLENIAEIASMAGPALVDPKTNRIFAAKILDYEQTELFTLNLFCPADNCMSTLDIIGTIPYNVNWITFIPDGSGIAFSEDNGNLYSYSFATKTATPLLVSDEHKTRPTFSPDGQKLAFLGAEHQLYIMNMTGQKIVSIGGRDINAISWLR